MSCQKVLSLLSAYGDGEAQTSDAEMIERHLSECDSCASEWKALQAMTGMLRTTPEVEPPAFLLAQIEAATVNRTGILARIQRAFDQIPTSARWATAPVAAAIVLMGVLLSNNVQVQTPVAVKSPTGHVEKAIPAAPEVTVEERSSSTATVVARRSAGSERTPAGSAGRPSDAARTSTGRTADRSAVVNSDASGIPVVEEPKLETPDEDEPAAPSETTDEPKTVTVARAESGDDASLSAKPSGEKAAESAVVLDDSGAIDQLRSRLSSKRSGKVNVGEDRIEGRKHSVGLVSLRF